MPEPTPRKQVGQVVDYEARLEWILRTQETIRRRRGTETLDAIREIRDTLLGLAIGLGVIEFVKWMAGS